MIKFLLTILLTLVFSNQFVQAQTRIISGILRDETGEPIPGVTIAIEGTDRGTATDINGYYNIEAKPGDVLIFRAVGMETRKVTVGDALVVKGTNYPNNNTSDKKDSIKFDFEKFILKSDSSNLGKKNSVIFNQNSPNIKFEGGIMMI